MVRIGKERSRIKQRGIGPPPRDDTKVRPLSRAFSLRQSGRRAARGTVQVGHDHIDRHDDYRTYNADLRTPGRSRSAIHALIAASISGTAAISVAMAASCSGENLVMVHCP